MLLRSGVTSRVNPRQIILFFCESKITLVLITNGTCPLREWLRLVLNGDDVLVLEGDIGVRLLV